MTGFSTREAEKPAAHPFAAAHSGLCAVCEQGFSEGDLITRAPGGWAHAICPEEKQMGEVCSACFVHKSLIGDCQC